MMKFDEVRDHILGVRDLFVEALHMYPKDELSEEEFLEMKPFTDEARIIALKMMLVKRSEDSVPELQKLLGELEECLHNFLSVPRKRNH